jgi:hypothetical protein
MSVGFETIFKVAKSIKVEFGNDDNAISKHNLKILSFVKYKIFLCEK